MGSFASSALFILFKFSSAKDFGYGCRQNAHVVASLPSTMRLVLAYEHPLQISLLQHVIKVDFCRSIVQSGCGKKQIGQSPR
mmetsp:Transcript_18216/g.27442  ORF Transcript_18216/g.27442 Transcript_18216/m.27442 type:complete len:82 (-) Transcript_18216:72-317(-)